MLEERERESDFSERGVWGWRFLDNKMRSDGGGSGGVCIFTLLLYHFRIKTVILILHLHVNGSVCL